MGETLDLSRFSTVQLCHCPTPLELMENLTAALGGPSIYIKRDDCTGLATGGNKTRKLEFLIGEAIEQGADTVITLGAVQSNHARQTAAAAAKFGLKCKILLERRVPDTAASYERTGNVLLDRMFGAELEFRSCGTDMNAAAQDLAERIREAGGKPYFIPGGGSNRVGALGYVSCALELMRQAKDQGLRIDHLVHATGSAGTQAGLVVGIEGSDGGIPIYGISVRNPRDKQESDVYDLVMDTAEYVGVDEISRDKVVANDDYVGPGYGQPTSAMVEAVSLLARTEGILLDPVYSGKGMAGLIGEIRKGTFSKDENIVFLHTGGSVALFAYETLFNNKAA
jgi:L-cysteate sulfo-lyase